MTEYYSGQGYIQDEAQDYDGAAWEAEPVAVKEISERAAPEYGGCMTWPVGVAGTNTPTQILQRRLRRHKGKVELTFPGAGTVTFNSNPDHLSVGQGYTVTVPAAGIYTFHDWESQQPLFAIASIAGIVAMTLDESYAER